MHKGYNHSSNNVTRTERQKHVNFVNLCCSNILLPVIVKEQTQVRDEHREIKALGERRRNHLIMPANFSQTAFGPTQRISAEAIRAITLVTYQDSLRELTNHNFLSIGI